MKILFFVQKIEDHMRHAYTDDLLMEEHYNRGHEVFAAEPGSIILQDRVIRVGVQEYEPKANDFVFKKYHIVEISVFDFCYFRALPPVADETLFATYILEKADVPFCNSVTSIRNFNEKLMVFNNFSEFMPKSIITRDITVVQNFVKEANWPIIQKPLDGYQASGINKLNNLKDLKEELSLSIFQEYLPEVEKLGSKRVYLLNGEFVGAVMYLPKPGGFKTNDRMIVAHAPTELTKKEQKVCFKVGPFLLKNGIRFAALDFISEYLLEINITSPGGITEFNDRYNANLEKKIVDEMSGSQL